ncbi:hypothetical protein Hanom_Chr09g00852401 [Helianthus anomalus]
MARNLIVSFRRRAHYVLTLLENYTGDGGRSNNNQNPTQSSESKLSWIARKCKPPLVFFAASQASASLVVTGDFLYEA